jgi:hypothetical protein
MLSSYSLEGGLKKMRRKDRNSLGLVTLHAFVVRMVNRNQKKVYLTCLLGRLKGATSALLASWTDRLGGITGLGKMMGAGIVGERTEGREKWVCRLAAVQREKWNTLVSVLVDM